MSGPITKMSDGESAAMAQPALDAISAGVLRIYGEHYGRAPKRATTYLNDNVVVCVLQEELLTSEELSAVRRGGDDAVLTARVAFQRAHEAEFVATVEGFTGRRVEAFLSANQTRPGVAAELFILARQ